MPITELKTLLDDAVLGKPEALEQFINYTDNLSFDEDDIKTVNAYFDQNKLQPTYKTNIQFMKAYWNYVGIEKDADEKAAIEFSDIAIKNATTNENVYAKWLRGRIYYDNGNLEAAQDLFGAALKDDPNNVRILSLLAQLYWDQNKDEDAFKILDTIKRINPSEGWNTQGILYYNRGRYPEAIESLDKAITHDNILAISTRAAMHREGMGEDPNDAEALRLYELGAKLNDPSLAIQAGKMYEEGVGCTKDNNKASEYYTQAAKLGSKLAQNHLEDLQNSINKEAAASSPQAGATPQGKVDTPQGKVETPQGKVETPQGKVETPQEKPGEIQGIAPDKMVSNKKMSLPQGDKPYEPRKKYLDVVDKLLGQFKNDIDKDKDKHDPVAHEKAEDLLVELTKYKTILQDAIKLASGPQSGEMRKAAIKQFKENCQSSMAKARPILENDLSLSKKLENLWIGFKNFFITIGQSLGSGSTLFALNESKLTQAAQKVEEKINKPKGP